MTGGAVVADGGVGERGGEDGPHVVGRPPALVDGCSTAEIEVHLERRGAAHHRATRGPDRVEEGLHRVVARAADRSVTPRPGLEPEREERDALLGERVAQATRVVGGGIAGEGERQGRRAQLDLSSGLEREHAAARQGAGLAGGGLDELDGDGAAGVGGVDDEPLELDADQAVVAGTARRAVEAARGHRAAGLDPGEDGSAGRHRLPVPEVSGHPVHVADRAELEMVDQGVAHGGWASWLLPIVRERGTGRPATIDWC